MDGYSCGHDAFIMYVLYIKNVILTICTEPLHAQPGCWLVVHQLGWEHALSHISLTDRGSLLVDHIMSAIKPMTLEHNLPFAFVMLVSLPQEM